MTSDIVVEQRRRNVAKCGLLNNREGDPPRRSAARIGARLWREARAVADNQRCGTQELRGAGHLGSARKAGDELTDSDQRPCLAPEGRFAGRVGAGWPWKICVMVAPRRPL